MDDDVRQVLAHAEAIIALTEPGGRGDDGEASPGQRVKDRASTQVGREYEDMARKLTADGSGMTAGQRAAQRRSDAARFTHLGQERGQRRRKALGIWTLEDV